MEVAENLYNEILETANTCVGIADISKAIGLKVKINSIVQVLVESETTTEILRIVGKFMRLEVTLTIFLGQQLRNELRRLTGEENVEDYPDR